MIELCKYAFVQALEAEVGGAWVDPGTLFTEDVIGWSPIATIAGLTAAWVIWPPTPKKHSRTSSSCCEDWTK